MEFLFLRLQLTVSKVLNLNFRFKPLLTGVIKTYKKTLKIRVTGEDKGLEGNMQKNFTIKTFFAL